MVSGNGRCSKMCSEVFWGNGCPLIRGISVGVQGCVGGGALLPECRYPFAEDFDGTPSVVAIWGKADHFSADSVLLSIEFECHFCDV
jgi:hypothetical protein